MLLNTMSNNRDNLLNDSLQKQKKDLLNKKIKILDHQERIIQDLRYFLQNDSINLIEKLEKYDQVQNKLSHFNFRNNRDRHTKYKSNNNYCPSLYVSGFSNKVNKHMLFDLFKSLDEKLERHMIILKNGYAFINFKNKNAAELAQNRIWNINGEILETNVRYREN